MFNELLAVVGFAVVLVGSAVLIAAAWRSVAHSMFWATTWMQRRAGRKQYAEKGWNTVPDEIPEGRYVVAVWENWKPEICQRKGDRMVNIGISFTLDGCVGWLDLPQLQKR